jgi:hypothetical protein
LIGNYVKLRQDAGEAQGTDEEGRSGFGGGSFQETAGAVVTSTEAHLWRELGEIVGTMSRYARREVQASYETWRRTHREIDPCDSKYFSIRAAIEEIHKRA